MSISRGNNTGKPFILDETEDFAVVFKPPRMHCAPAKNRYGNTLLDWYAAIFPSVTELSGRKEGEGGLLHRLDFETQGLMLLAKNQRFMDCLLLQQNEGNFVKEYSAICQKAAVPHSSFPPSPSGFPVSGFPFAIESFFRPFGPGRKQVRPVISAGGRCRKIASDKGGFYRTVITGINETDDRERYAAAVRLCRGFRHQIRCHFAWIGYPVLNDPLYGDEAVSAGTADASLALRATGLVFADPGSGRQREYRIAGLALSQLAPSSKIR